MEDILEHIINEKLVWGVPVTKIQYDADIQGATIGQLWLLIRGIGWLDTERQALLFQDVGAVAHKLGALRYHTSQYRAIEERRRRDIESDRTLQSEMRRGVMHSERELLYEFEAFWHQFKSALDMLVKILHPLMHMDRGALHTYGDKGDKIIGMLKAQMRNKCLAREGKLRPEALPYLVKLVESVRDQRFRSLIDLRDTISHRQVFARFGFAYVRVTSPIVVTPMFAAKLVPPMIDVNGELVPVLHVLDEATKYLIDYACEFITYAIACVSTWGLGWHPMIESEKRYYSAVLGMDVTSAKYALSTGVIKEYSDEEIERAAKEHGKRGRIMNLPAPPQPPDPRAVGNSRIATDVASSDAESISLGTDDEGA